MSLKIGTSAAWFDLRTILGLTQFSLRASGADIRYLITNEKPTDFADYALRTDVNTETVVDLVNYETYEVADNTIYRLNEIVTILSTSGAVKGQARVIEKDANTTSLKVEIIPTLSSSAFSLADDDKIFITSDEILKEDLDFLHSLETYAGGSNYIFALASSEVADNLLITKTGKSKKKN